MKLHAERFGTGPSLIVIHGLFGSGSNWRTTARRLSSHLDVHLLDLRNHGRSPHADDMGYPALVDDVIEYMDDAGLVDVAMLGHSLGGKVAMHCALQVPERLASLIVADISPVGRGNPQRKVLSAMKAVDVRLAASRKEIADRLFEALSDRALAMFLATNLERGEGSGFRWRLNLDAIDRGYEALCAPIGQARPCPVPSLFLRGGASPYVPESHFSSILDLFPRARFETLAGAGHWLHIDAPEEFSLRVVDFVVGGPG